MPRSAELRGVVLRDVTDDRAEVGDVFLAPQRTDGTAGVHDRRSRGWSALILAAGLLAVFLLALGEPAGALMNLGG